MHTLNQPQAILYFLQILVITNQSCFHFAKMLAANMQKKKTYKVSKRQTKPNFIKHWYYKYTKERETLNNYAGLQQCKIFKSQQKQSSVYKQAPTQNPHIFFFLGNYQIPLVRCDLSQKCKSIFNVSTQQRKVSICYCDPR